MYTCLLVVRITLKVIKVGEIRRQKKHSERYARITKSEFSKTEIRNLARKVSQYQDQADASRAEIEHLKGQNQRLRQHPKDLLSRVGGEIMLFTGAEFLRLSMIRSFNVSDGMLTKADDFDLQTICKWTDFAQALDRIDQGEAE